MKNSQKIKIHWWEDSYGRSTIHKNEMGLSFDQSYLGIIDHIDNKWWYRLKDSDERVGPFPTVAVARKKLEDAVGGEQIDIWD